MSAPDYTDAQIDAREAARQTWAPGGRVSHFSGRRGTITKLHAGTLKRPRPIGQWRVSVLWDGRAKPTIHPVTAVRRCR